MLSLMFNQTAYKKYPMFNKTNLVGLVEGIEPLFFADKAAESKFAKDNPDQMLVRIPTELKHSYKNKAIKDLGLTGDAFFAAKEANNTMPSLFIKPSDELIKYMKIVDLEITNIGEKYHLNMGKIMFEKHVTDTSKQDINLNAAINFNGDVKSRDIGVLTKQAFQLLDEKILAAVKSQLTNVNLEIEEPKIKRGPRM